MRGAWAIVGDSPKKDGVSEKFGIKFFDVRKGWDVVVKELELVYKRVICEAPFQPAGVG